MGHLLDHAAHAGHIENADVAITEICAILHQHTVTVVKHGLHALTVYRHDLVRFRDGAAVKEDAVFAHRMVLPICAIARSRSTTAILYTVHPFQRHAKPALVNVAAHRLSEGLQILLAMLIQRTVKGQKEQLTLGQLAMLGLAMNVKPLYTRNRGGSLYDRGWYDVGDWRICGKHVLTENFTLDTMPCVLKSLEALGRRGFAPDGELALHFVPKHCNMEMVMNAYTILDARRELVEMALGLKEEVRLVVDRDLAFSLPLDAFSIPAIEACACLLVQVCAMAASTRKARMKPCDMSNPKYQMRSWLLRLGFIGEQFARPRQTLLEHLDGNAAFFDDVGRQKAKEKRQRQKAMALA